MTRLTNLIQSAVRREGISPAEAKAIVQEAQSDGQLSQTEHAELTKLLEQHVDAFDSTSRAIISSFLDGSAPFTTDPKVMRDDVGKVRYQDVVGGQLYVDGIGFDDITQGETGDCYFLSALAAFAKTQPEIIRNAIVENADGTYTVTFFEKDKSRRLYEVSVTVDGDLATNKKGELQYAAPREPGELWGSIMEKAYASWKGGFENIGNGGFAADAFMALSGKKTETFNPISELSADELWSSISTAAVDGRPTLTGTFGEKAAAKNGLQYEPLGLQPGHMYALLSVDERNGQRFVTLRDPHGNVEPGNGTDGTLDGIFEMKFEEYQAQFEDVHMLVN
jgi:Calpain family cysteine protease